MELPFVPQASTSARENVIGANRELFHRMLRDLALRSVMYAGYYRFTSSFLQSIGAMFQFRGGTSNLDKDRMSLSCRGSDIPMWKERSRSLPRRLIHMGLECFGLNYAEQPSTLNITTLDLRLVNNPDPHSLRRLRAWGEFVPTTNHVHSNL